MSVDGIAQNLWWVFMMLVGGVLVACAYWLEYVFSYRDGKERRDAFLQMLPLPRRAVQPAAEMLDEIMEFILEVLPIVLVFAFVGMVVWHVVMPSLG